MQIIVDGVKDQDSTLLTGEFSEIYQKLTEKLKKTKRVVTSIKVDGEPVGKKEVPDWTPESVKSCETLEVDTINPYEVSLSILEELLQSFDKLQDAHKLASLKIHEGKNTEALRILYSCLNYWQVIIKSINNICATLELNPADVKLGNSPMLDEFNALFVSCQKFYDAVNAADILKLADVSEYEMKPLVPVWKNNLYELIKIVQTK